MITVVLADDQAVVRDGLGMLLTAADDIEVVGTAADGAQAVAQVVATGPDVALLDLRMPNMDGAQATEELAAKAPRTRVLILTTFADDDAILPALRAGAVGYLTKDTSGEDLVAAIRDVAAGRTVLDPNVQRRLVELLRAGPASASSVAAPPPASAGPPPPASSGPPPPASAGEAEQLLCSPPGSAPAEPAADLGLTRREIDVVRLVAEGLSNQQIATRLFLGEATVKTHLNHVLSKLDVDGRSGLVAWAWRNGLAG